MIEPKNNFGLSATVNPSSGVSTLQTIQNVKTKIPTNINFIGTNMVGVYVGLVPTETSFVATSFNAVILNDDGTTLITLQPKLGIFGSGQVPTDNEIFWYNRDGLAGSYWVSSTYIGKTLKIGGEFFVSTVGSAFSSGWSLLKESVFNVAGDYTFIPNPLTKMIKVKIYPASSAGGFLSGTLSRAGENTIFNTIKYLGNKAPEGHAGGSGIAGGGASLGTGIDTAGAGAGSGGGKAESASGNAENGDNTKGYSSGIGLVGTNGVGGNTSANVELVLNITDIESYDFTLGAGGKGLSASGGKSGDGGDAVIIIEEYA